jgi:3-hydroxyisobutyrate dehydrogenase-like beta-hydroxyacid dehydrogenase
MGAAVGAALRSAGHDVVWVPGGRSPQTARRADDAGLRRADDVQGCAVVLSIVPPSAAVVTARSLTGFTGIVVDANAISPTTASEVARLVADGGGTYVDGGIIGPPPVTAGTTRLYLSGTAAVDVVRLFEGTCLDARALTEGGDTAASALKMAYAAWTKISAALVLAARSTAAGLGVEDALVAEWALSRPDLASRWQAAHRDAETKGWRWADEMREIARTLASAGQPEQFGEAAAALFDRCPRPG